MAKKELAHLDDARKNVPGAIWCIGKFDGFHMGHMALIDLACKQAKEQGKKVGLLTFSPNPTVYFLKNPKFPLILEECGKKSWLEQSKIDAFVCLEFNNQLVRKSPKEFVQDVLLDGLGASAVVVGDDFEFGYKKQGDVHLLRTLLHDKGADLYVQKFVSRDGVVCSSSKIRRLVSQGDVEAASKLLGRPYSLRGQVIHGEGKGAKFGFPTANLAPIGYLLPGEGVYLTFVKIPGQSQPIIGATNIGKRPTLDRSGNVHIETHLLDFTGNIYGNEVEIYFAQKIRDEAKFDSVAQLVSQIERDVEQVRNLAKKKIHGLP